jgi:hypothetical protein
MAERARDPIFWEERSLARTIWLHAKCDGNLAAVTLHAHRGVCSG